jgi:putative ABC transport system permease protein
MLVIVIGLGIGASMTMITVIHVMTKDPAPTLSGRLFYPAIDASPPGWQGPVGRSFTWDDASNLLRAHMADRQAAMAGGRALVEPAQKGSQPFFVRGHLVTAEFFGMFDAPFERGAGWAAEQDFGQQQVAVLNGEFARRLFRSSNPIGKTVSLDGADYRVVGVLSDWHPQPLFYGGLSGDYAFGEGDQFFVPLQTALVRKMQITGGMSCWANALEPRKGDQCEWLQFWVRLEDPRRRAEYTQFLNSYWMEQQRHGRMLRLPNSKLTSLMERLQLLELVPDDVSRQMLLAQLFFVVCLLNSMGLLFAKFSQMAPQISVRRALGARKKDIFSQLLSEAALVGVFGAALGWALTTFGLSLVRAQPDQFARLAHLDVGMLALTLVLAILSSVAAGAIPAWRACQTPPALELKLQ